MFGYNRGVLIGILSDTHGHVEATGVAIELLRGRGATYFLHCGDVGSPAVLDQMAGLSAAFVWGNCDSDRTGLQRYAERLGIGCHGAYGDLTIDGKRVALMHGDDGRLSKMIVAEQKHDYLCHGHTHTRGEGWAGRVHVINPGAVHRAKERTVALLDTVSDRVEFLVAG